MEMNGKPPTEEEIKAKAELAMHKLIMAKLLKKEREIAKWQNHLDYWMIELNNSKLRSL